MRGNMRCTSYSLENINEASFMFGWLFNKGEPWHKREQYAVQYDSTKSMSMGTEQSGKTISNILPQKFSHTCCADKDQTHTTWNSLHVKWYLILFQGIFFRPLFAFLVCCKDVFYVTVLKGIWVIDFSQTVSRLLWKRQWVKEVEWLHLGLLVVPDFKPFIRLC